MIDFFICVVSLLSRLTIANLSSFDVSSIIIPSLFILSMNFEEVSIDLIQSTVSTETHTDMLVLLVCMSDNNNITKMV